jgi:hypothetical protein
MSKSHKFLGWVASILGTVIGGVLLYVLTASPQPDPMPLPGATTLDPNISAIDFQITDELGDGQVTERVAVVIDGRSVGTLTVDTVHRTASLTVTVPKPGRYEYELSSSMILEDEYGTTYQLNGHGTGLLQVTSGRSYAVWGNYGLDPVMLELN